MASHGEPLGIQLAIENGHVSWENHGKSHYFDWAIFKFANSQKIPEGNSLLLKHCIKWWFMSGTSEKLRDFEHFLISKLQELQRSSQWSCICHSFGSQWSRQVGSRQFVCFFMCFRDLQEFDIFLQEFCGWFLTVLNVKDWRKATCHAETLSPGASATHWHEHSYWTWLFMVDLNL